jgi:hypothetical protein
LPGRTISVICAEQKEGLRSAAVATNNTWLNTRNPGIHSLKDFTASDSIAVPSLKVSAQQP